jgi:hypothetical protein
MPTNAIKIQPHGKKFVTTEDGDYLAISEMLTGGVLLPNGQPVPVKRLFTGTAIATGASNSQLIAAPGDATIFYAILAYTVLCDANTLVTFLSNNTVIGMPLPCAANGGVTRLPTLRPLMICQPGQNLAITTSGGNTYLDLHYIEVPSDLFDVL